MGETVRIRWSVPKNEKHFRFRLISIMGEHNVSWGYKDTDLNRRDLLDKEDKTILFYTVADKRCTVMALTIFTTGPDAAPRNPNKVFKPIKRPRFSNSEIVSDWVEKYRYTLRVQGGEAYTIHLKYDFCK